MSPQLILASLSPRRQELLSQMGLAFTVIPPLADENLQGAAEQVVVELARRKALSVAAAHPQAYVLAADTLVYLGARALGKPKDQSDAAAMLRALSGAWHEVHTGVCLAVPGAGMETGHAVTQVLFSRMTEEEIAAYCASGEPLGKAGAYAIQGLGGMYVEQIRGSYTNVVGLPTSLVRQMLKKTKYL